MRKTIRKWMRKRMVDNLRAGMIYGVNFWHMTKAQIEKRRKHQGSRYHGR